MAFSSSFNAAVRNDRITLDSTALVPGGTTGSDHGYEGWRGLFNFIPHENVIFLCLN
jgi:hypothetical protein